MKPDSHTSEERIRLQIPLPPAVARDLSRHADELQRSQAWLAAWALGIGFDDRPDLCGALLKRMKNPAKFKLRVAADGGGEVRLQVRVEAKVARWIEETAAVLHSSPGKFAALLIDLGLENNRDILKFMKTTIGKTLRRWVRGPKEDFTNADPRDEDGESGDSLKA